MSDGTLAAAVYVAVLGPVATIIPVCEGSGAGTNENVPPELVTPLPVTVQVKSSDPPGATFENPGEITVCGNSPDGGAVLAGVTTITTLVEMLGSATDVAVIVTFVFSVTKEGAGAVYVAGNGPATFSGVDGASEPKLVPKVTPLFEGSFETAAETWIVPPAVTVVADVVSDMAIISGGCTVSVADCETTPPFNAVQL